MFFATTKANKTYCDVKYEDNCFLVFGKERSADELAEVLGTINYEITCDVGKRVPRIYTDDNK